MCTYTGCRSTSCIASTCFHLLQSWMPFRSTCMQPHAIHVPVLCCRYDVGITGGVTSMDNFLEKFFPHVAAQAKAGNETGGDAYCTYSDTGLQLFTSSLFLAAAFAGLAGSWTTRYSFQTHAMHRATLHEKAHALRMGVPANCTCYWNAGYRKSHRVTCSTRHSPM